MKKVIIIGGGPAGLTAAYELLRTPDEYEVVVFEEDSQVGGIAKTVNYKGRTQVLLENAGSQCLVG